MDYTSLVGTKTTEGSIARWINVKDTYLDLEEILSDAQNVLFNGGLVAGSIVVNPLRIRDMRTTGASVAIVANEWTSALPADFLAPIIMLNPMWEPIDYFDIPSLQDARSVNTDGTPQVATYPTAFAVDGSNFLFDFAPDANITMKLDYYARPAALSSGNPTNFLTTKYSHLLRAACLVAAADFINNDEKYNRNVAKLAGMLHSINVTDEADQQGMQVARTYPRNYGAIRI